MSTNYFAIEREGKCADHIVITDEDGNIAFGDLMDMSYEEMKSYNNIDEFVVGVMDAANAHFGSGTDEQTLVTLVNANDLFIWSVLVGPGNNAEELRYAFVDWLKDGKNYRYEKD